MKDFVEFEIDGTSLYVHLLDDVTKFNSDDIYKAFLNESIENVRAVYLDFREVNFIDSYGIGILIKMKAHADSNSVTMVLCDIESNIRKTIERVCGDVKFKVFNKYFSRMDEDSESVLD